MKVDTTDADDAHGPAQVVRTEKRRSNRTEKRGLLR